MNTKQVIIVRKDLKNKHGHKVKSGKMGAQIAHAALGAVKSMMEVKIIENYRGDKLHTDYILRVEPKSALEDWWEGRFTKPVLGCDSLQELLEFERQAKKAGLPTCLIKDAGLTEFSEPTITCLAIGPALSEDIDKITGHLNLL